MTSSASGLGMLRRLFQLEHTQERLPDNQAYATASSAGSYIAGKRESRGSGGYILTQNDLVNRVPSTINGATTWTIDSIPGSQDTANFPGFEFSPSPSPGDPPYPPLPVPLLEKYANL